MLKKEERKYIKYTLPFGEIKDSYISWDDFDKNLKDQIIKYKIINIILYGNKILDDINLIGISITYKNLFNNEIKNIEYKGNEDINYTKEINIENKDEYFNKFNIYYDKIKQFISYIYLSTNKNKEISLGIKQGNKKFYSKIKGDNIIIGSFGSYDKNIKSLGFIYTTKKFFDIKNLFGYFLIRYRIKNEKFKEYWDNKIKDLDILYQYLWKTAHLPDAIFLTIIKFCI